MDKHHPSKARDKEHKLFPKKLESNQVVNLMQSQKLVMELVKQLRLQEHPEQVEMKLEEAPTQLTHSL